MKSFLAKALVLITCFVSIHASAQEAVEGDLRGKAEFVRTCPRKFRTSSYEANGVIGAYCACPEANIAYVDKAEGGPGWYCAPSASHQ